MNTDLTELTSSISELQALQRNVKSRQASMMFKDGMTLNTSFKRGDPVEFSDDGEWFAGTVRHFDDEESKVTVESMAGGRMEFFLSGLHDPEVKPINDPIKIAMSRLMFYRALPVNIYDGNDSVKKRQKLGDCWPKLVGWYGTPPMVELIAYAITRDIDFDPVAIVEQVDEWQRYAKGADDAVRQRFIASIFNDLGFSFTMGDAQVPGVIDFDFDES